MHGATMILLMHGATMILLMHGATMKFIAQVLIVECKLSVTIKIH
jgi:hypothetical protein